ncbi:MAG: universal stress protein [Gemmatimonadaceae bacterium]|nr:universal stress protein [Gemmatimonadaceae bacterium]
MSTATRPTAPFSGYSPTSTDQAPILVATDVSPQSDAAFPLAHALATRTNSGAYVVSATRPFAMPMYAFDASPIIVGTDHVVLQTHEASVQAQRARLVGETAEWPVAIRVGEPAQEIVDYARELHARVIVVGRGRHAALQRALGGETVLRLLQLGDTPVLATETRLSAPATRVIIATDFTDFSLYAAQVALPLVADDARITLVHVAPPFVQTDSALLDRAIAYRNQALHGFEHFRERLMASTPPARFAALTIEDAYVEGNPSDEIVRLVRATDAELVVTSTHGYGFLRRLLLGSVAAELVRHAPCSVLCVPGSAQTLRGIRQRPAVTSRTRALDMAVLDAELQAWTAQHALRRCTVEIDDPSLGAQILGHALPLVAATYDRHDRAVSLMFGASPFAAQHLTHAVPGVTAVEVRSDEAGRDQVLRLVHDGGQTLVLLE